MGPLPGTLPSPGQFPKTGHVLRPHGAPWGPPHGAWPGGSHRELLRLFPSEPPGSRIPQSVSVQQALGQVIAQRGACHLCVLERGAWSHGEQGTRPGPQRPQGSGHPRGGHGGAAPHPWARWLQPGRRWSRGPGLTGPPAPSAAGFTGQNCEENVDDCPGNNCKNGGACVDGVNTYNCRCPPEWTGAAARSGAQGRRGLGQPRPATSV